MSIYATLWTLKFPRDGECAIEDEDWVEVFAQGVPAFIGTYPDQEDYVASFLPPCPPEHYGNEDGVIRAVVFVTDETDKGTERSGQEYVDPLLVLTGLEYEAISFKGLHDKICEALRHASNK
ncbi:MAG: hypothetical protein ACR2QC_02485 [Gammaproteobacteria bacterium]